MRRIIKLFLTAAAVIPVIIGFVIYAPHIVAPFLETVGQTEVFGTTPADAVLFGPALAFVAILSIVPAAYVFFRLFFGGSDSSSRRVPPPGPPPGRF